MAFTARTVPRYVVSVLHNVNWYIQTRGYGDDFDLFSDVHFQYVLQAWMPGTMGADCFTICRWVIRGVRPPPPHISSYVTLSCLCHLQCSMLYRGTRLKHSEEWIDDYVKAIPNAERKPINVFVFSRNSPCIHRNGSSFGICDFLTVVFGR